MVQSSFAAVNGFAKWNLTDALDFKKLALLLLQRVGRRAALSYRNSRSRPEIFGSKFQVGVGLNRSLVKNDFRESMTEQGASPRHVCNVVLVAARPRFDRLVARPWNRFEPEHSEWWLVPSQDWPAYAEAKFFFARSRSNSKNLEIGLYLEKGLGQAIRDAYPSARGRHFIMSDDWAWSEMVSADATQRIRESVQGETHRPSCIRVEAGYVADPGSFDPYSSGFTRGRCTFEIRGDTLIGQIEDEPGHLHPIHNAVSLKDLVAGLALITKNDWIWVDLFLFRSYEVGQDTAETIGQEAWQQHLVHLLGWMDR